MVLDQHASTITGGLRLICSFGLTSGDALFSIDAVASVEYSRYNRQPQESSPIAKVEGLRPGAITIEQLYDRDKARILKVFLCQTERRGFVPFSELFRTCG